MRTTRRPTRATGILTAGLAARLATGLVLTGCEATPVGAEDRAAGAAGGQSPRDDDGGPGRVTKKSPSSVESDRGGLSSPAAPPGSGADAADEPVKGSEKWRVRQPAAARFVEVVTGNVLRGFAGGPAERRHPAHDNVRDFDFDLSPANAVSAS